MRLSYSFLEFKKFVLNLHLNGSFHFKEDFHCGLNNFFRVSESKADLAFTKATTKFDDYICAKV